MARAIDAEKFMELLKEQYLHHKSMGHNQMAKAWQGAMQLLHDMPTLTPPNEPLSIEQLREMDGEPVWVVLVDEKFSGLNGWYLVHHGSAYLARIDDWELDDDKYGVEWLAYRRPPEGEEDT